MAKEPVRLDVTNSLVVTQRFESRTSEGEKLSDGGFGTVIDRLNLTLRWQKWTVGARIDSANYWRRPVDRDDLSEVERSNVLRDSQTRFNDSLYPAKLWVTYSSPGLEITAGDSYVQFGRGLVLSMRKLDDLGVDTTLRGAKVQVQKDPIGFTVVAGFANPSRVDEATGTSLFLAKANPPSDPYPRPVFGSDRIVGAELQAGRGLPVVLATRAVRLTRCAPYHYDSVGRVEESFFTSQFGTCDERDTAIWLESLPRGLGPVINAKEVDQAGQSIEIPTLWGHGKIYVEAAVQRRKYHDDPNRPNTHGNALYASITGNAGPVTALLELKSYRNFYPLAGGVDQSRAAAFSTVTYSAPPTAELITQDSMFGFFNACVDGGRLRTDFRLNDDLLVYAAGIYAYTKTEITAGSCDSKGRTLSGPLKAEEVQTTVVDGLSGVEWNFDHALSHLYAFTGVRNNMKENGEMYYRETYTQYIFQKHISGPFTIEVNGRHRIRQEEFQNLRGPGGTEKPWREGEHYTAFKIAPQWIFSQGFEYTTRLGWPTYYFNGSVLWRFRSDSSVRVFAGQQRGGLRCISGICRQFPAFEGARVELTLRF